nr:MAG TPA: hypothetical protein [Caudoviricetes sp.]DAH76304.1 MAG TPA: hypothetical protein [Caudoviricetes sp.]
MYQKIEHMRTISLQASCMSNTCIEVCFIKENIVSPNRILNQFWNL